MSDDVKTDDAPNRELNDRQKAFCMSYTKDFNGSRAAIEAGYSEDSSRQIASELLTKPNIRAEIERILNESSRAQIPEIIKENLELWRKMAANTELSPKDRLKASELAGKYAAMFIDKVEVKNEGPVIIRYDDGNSKTE